jgi:hypothetical protein
MTTDALDRRFDAAAREGREARELRAVERALEQAETDRAKLMPNGQRLYAGDEHARREAAIETTLQATIERVTAAADEAVKDAAASLDRLTDADPLTALTAAEQEAASRRATFVREDAERLPVPDLTRRLVQAMDEDDRAALYLWARYGDARLQAEQRAGRLGPAAAEQLHRLATVLREAGERFVDQRGRERAAATLETARAFRSKVSQAVHPLLVQQTLVEMKGSGRYRNLL